MMSQKRPTPSSVVELIAFSDEVDEGFVVCTEERRLPEEDVLEEGRGAKWSGSSFGGASSTSPTRALHSARPIVDDESWKMPSVVRWSCWVKTGGRRRWSSGTCDVVGMSGAWS